MFPPSQREFDLNINDLALLQVRPFKRMNAERFGSANRNRTHDTMVNNRSLTKRHWNSLRECGPSKPAASRVVFPSAYVTLIVALAEALPNDWGRSLEQVIDVFRFKLFVAKLGFDCFVKVVRLVPPSFVSPQLLSVV